MHIEIGIIEPARLIAANAAALAVVATQIPAVMRNKFNIPKAILAAVAFSVMMQVWHLPIGPSELHLIGATSIYLLFGFAPAMVGFAFGLFLQAFFFEPQDMAHLGVNALSLMIPMITVHYTFGRRLFSAMAKDRFSLAKVLRLDAVYYAGVSSMVGFWLMLSNIAFPFSDWLQWMVAYFPVFMLEAVLTFGVVMIMRRWKGNRAVAALTDVTQLRFA